MPWLLLGSEENVCVPATLANAVDVGYQVIVVCPLGNSSDERQDVLICASLSDSFAEPIETSDAAIVLTRE
jgi:nicotinamidase-related amidase